MAAIKSFSQVYALPKDALLPGTITFYDPGGKTPDQVMDIQVQARLAGGAVRVVRHARLGFEKDKTKLLRMPLHYSCFDFGCPGDQTCHAGSCVAPDVDVTTLADFTSEAQVVVRAPANGAPSNACFVAATCLKNLETVMH